MKAPIDFYFDFTSPYSYITNEWVDALAARHGRTVRRHAILLGAVFKATGGASPVTQAQKRDYSLRDFARSARFEGLPYRAPEVFPVATQAVARVFHWQRDTVDEAAAAHWARTVFRAYFTQGLILSDPDALPQLALAAGVDADAAQAASVDARWKDALRQATDQALAIGLFGVPLLVVDGELFWGNDRKAQVERTLAQGPI